MTRGATFKGGALSLVVAVLVGALVWQTWFLDDEGHDGGADHPGLELGNCGFDPKEVIARAPTLRELKVEILDWDVVAGGKRVELFKRDGPRLILIVRGGPAGGSTVMAIQNKQDAWMSKPIGGCA